MQPFSYFTVKHKVSQLLDKESRVPCKARGQQLTYRPSHKFWISNENIHWSWTFDLDSMSSFCVLSKWAFFFFWTFLAETLLSAKRCSALPISRLTFPHRLLSSCKMVKHHRSARLPVDEQAAEHMPARHKGMPSQSLLLLFHGLQWDIHLTKLQQTANLWEKHPETWALMLRLLHSLQQHSISTNLMPGTLSAPLDRLLDAVTRHQHCFLSHFIPEKS